MRDVIDMIDPFFEAVQWLDPGYVYDKLYPAAGEGNPTVASVSEEMQAALMDIKSVERFAASQDNVFARQVARMVDQVASKYASWRTTASQAKGIAFATDPVRFWKQCEGHVGVNCTKNFIPLAAALCITPISSADAERFHSKYRYILSDRRHGLSFNNLRTCAFLYANGESLDLAQSYLRDKGVAS